MNAIMTRWPLCTGVHHTEMLNISSYCWKLPAMSHSLMAKVCQVVSDHFFIFFLYFLQRAYNNLLHHFISRILLIKRFHLKVIYFAVLWFCITMLCDCLEKLVQLGHAVRNKTKWLTRTPPPPYLLNASDIYIITWSFDCWMNGLSACLVTGHSDCLGFGLTILDWKLLYANKVLTDICSCL